MTTQNRTRGSVGKLAALVEQQFELREVELAVLMERNRLFHYPHEDDGTLTDFDDPPVPPTARISEWTKQVDGHGIHIQWSRVTRSGSPYCDYASKMDKNDCTVTNVSDGGSATRTDPRARIEKSSWGT